MANEFMQQKQNLRFNLVCFTLLMLSIDSDLFPRNKAPWFI
jgi:hypothetical protein